MTGKKLRKITFNIRGISEFQSTPPFLKEGLGCQYEWVREILLEVKLPRRLQTVKHHPILVERLITDIPELSVKRGGLPCGKNEDFVVKLKKGRENLGHTFEHLLAWAQVEISCAYADHREFIFQTRVDARTTHSTVYQILTFYSGQLPPSPEYFGIESLVCGYTNALMDNRLFLIRDRIHDFIEYRSEALEETEQVPVHSKIHKISHKIKNLFNSVILLINTS